jgi:phosphoserine phosphatase RsbU/P
MPQSVDDAYQVYANGRYIGQLGSLLTMLNRRLLGRSGGHFATCLAAEFLPDGTMTIANAGHLPPYRNGQEIELEGSLPLGLSSDAASPVQTITLEPGYHITFLTDGVIEAMNPANELFGFERSQQISGKPAASIAQQARAFGQNDDITVLAVEFTGVAQSALA